jgi:hypothetical protein
VICSASASAQFGDFALAAGYSHIYPQTTGGLNFSKDGAYIDGDLAWRLPGPAPIMLGFGITASGTYQYQNFQFVNNNNNFISYTTLYSDVENIGLEPRIALNIRIPGMPGLEIRPRLGAGLLIDDYGIDVAQPVNNFVFFNTVYHTGAAFDIRPDLQVGFTWRGASAGLDASYMAAWGSFGALGDNLQELRVGLYFRCRF